MKEKLEKKLLKILAKAGLDEEKANEIVEEVKSAVSEEDAPDSTDPEDTPNPEGQETNEGNDQEGTTPPPSEEGEIPPVPPVPPTEEQVPPAPAPEVPPAEIPPEVPPAVPTVNPNLQKALALLEEQQKANQGLLARVNALEEALRSAGIIEGSAPQTVGVETPTPLPESINNQGNILSDVLAQINGKSKLY